MTRDRIVILMIAWFYASRLACFWYMWRMELLAHPLPRAKARRRA